MRTLAVIGLGVVCAVTLAVPPASAAQKVGCPASSKWLHVTYEEAAVLIYDGAPAGTYPDPGTVLALLKAKYDKNDSPKMCIDPVPSEERNPNSELNWFYLRDDNSNGRG